MITMREGLGLVLFAALAATGCGDGASRHAADGDTGAAAPATVRDMSATPTRDSGTAPGVARQPADSMAGRAATTPARPMSAPRGTP
jgi:hypothetical protein